MVKVKGKKAGICDGAPSTAALVYVKLMFNIPVNNFFNFSHVGMISYDSYLSGFIQY